MSKVKIKLSNKKKVFNYKQPTTEEINHKESHHFEDGGMYCILIGFGRESVFFIKDRKIKINYRTLVRQGLLGLDGDGDSVGIVTIKDKKYVHRLPYSVVGNKLVELSKLVDGHFNNDKYVVGKFNTGSHLMRNKRYGCITIVNYN